MCLSKMQISANAIMCWKAMIVIYKLLREGHPEVGDEVRQIPGLKSVARLYNIVHIVFI